MLKALTAILFSFSYLGFDQTPSRTANEAYSATHVFTGVRGDASVRIAVAKAPAVARYLDGWRARLEGRPHESWFGHFDRIALEPAELAEGAATRLVSRAVEADQWRVEYFRPIEGAEAVVHVAVSEVLAKDAAGWLARADALAARLAREAAADPAGGVVTGRWSYEDERFDIVVVPAGS